MVDPNKLYDSFDVHAQEAEPVSYPEPMDCEPEAKVQEGPACDYPAPITIQSSVLESCIKRQEEMETKKQETENQIRILSQALSLLSVEMYANKQIIDLLTAQK